MNNNTLDNAAAELATQLATYVLNPRDGSDDSNPDLANALRACDARLTVGSRGTVKLTCNADCDVQDTIEDELYSLLGEEPGLSWSVEDYLTRFTITIWIEN